MKSELQTKIESMPIKDIAAWIEENCVESDELRGELIEFYCWYSDNIESIEKYSHNAIDVIDEYLKSN
jgi:hypothetical protein